MVVGGALFGNSTGGRSMGPKALCEFRAGKMTLSGTTVSPDKRKGLVQVDQGEDQLMHFKWKDRTTNVTEDDLIIFPDDIEFKRVTQCTTGRVYILKFKSSNKKMFFWMQEPKTDKDEEYCKKVNDLLNNPPAPGSASRSGGGGGSGGLGGPGGLDLSNIGDSEITSMLSNMNQQQLMQLLGGTGGPSGLASLLSGGAGGRQRSAAGRSAARESSAGSGAASTPASGATEASSGSASTPSSAATPATTAASSATSASTPKPATTNPAAATPAAGGGANAIRLSDLQNILSGLQIPAEAGASGAAAAAGGGASEPHVDLSAGITADAMKPLLSNKDFVKGMKELLPTEAQTDNLDEVANEINDTVQSPQFQQALSTFSSALQTGQLAPLIRNFGLGDEATAAATSGNMKDFIKALVKHQEAEKKKADEPEDMALD